MEAKDAALSNLIFTTRCGAAWTKAPKLVQQSRTKTASGDDSVSKEFAKLLRVLRLNGRKGLGFYTLRHTFRTVADETRDQAACDYIMGHSRDDMASAYRERIADSRLQAVVEHVHTWLFGVEGQKHA
jgi:integrase